MKKNNYFSENREKAANLMMLSIVYSEDFMTQFLYQCLPAFLELAIAKNKEDDLDGESKEKKQEDDVVVEKICKSLQLLGRFCDYNSFFPIIKSSLLVFY